MTAAGGPSGTKEKLVYKPSFDALIAGVSDRATPAFRDELAALGVSIERLLPGYPYDKFERSVQAAAKLFPARSAADCASPPSTSTRWARP